MPTASVVIATAGKTPRELEQAIASRLARADAVVVWVAAVDAPGVTAALQAVEPFDLPVWQRSPGLGGESWRRVRGPWRTAGQRTLKRALDVGLALALLLALSPILAAIAMLIRLDSPGPVLFRHARVGRNMQPFTMLKFRSMRHAAAGPAITRSGDPRVTGLGRFLRATSLDELPQLLNVLRGEMSLVGPRPLPVDFAQAGCRFADVVPRYNLRHAVLPGLTGLAQVQGYRSMPDDPAAATRHVARRVALDRLYVRRGSLGLDLRLLLLTVTRGSWRTNAH